MVCLNPDSGVSPTFVRINLSKTCRCCTAIVGSGNPLGDPCGRSRLSTWQGAFHSEYRYSDPIEFRGASACIFSASQTGTRPRRLCVAYILNQNGRVQPRPFFHQSRIFLSAHFQDHFVYIHSGLVAIAIIIGSESHPDGFAFVIHQIKDR